MQFEHAFEIRASPADLIEKFDDLPLMAAFLPGASVGPANGDGSYPGTLTVSFGPKRITFQGSLRNEVNRAELRGVMSGSANADVRGARMAVKLYYGLSEVEGSHPAATRVSLLSEAQLSGMLDQFAKTGGKVLVSAILDEFARRFSAYLACEDGGPAGLAKEGSSANAMDERRAAGGVDAADAAAATAAAGAANQASALPIGMIIAGVFRQWMRRMGALLRRSRRER